MGVSYDHTVVLHFTNSDDCERFNNYLERNIEKRYFTRTSGFDIEDNTWDRWNRNTTTPKWYLYEMFEQGYEDDNTPIYFDMDLSNNTVQLDSNGYGNIPAFIISYAFKQYNADQLYMTGAGCQGQPQSKWKVVYNKEYDQVETINIPDWVDGL